MMTKINRIDIERLVREVILKEYSRGGDNGRHLDKESGVMSIKLPIFDVTEEHRLDTGNPEHHVYTRDLVTVEESPRLGLGLMVMKDTIFDWHLGYDEIDYMIEGTLSVIIDGRKITAGPGEIMYIPKDSDIQFSVEGTARFIYITYPADWNG